ncbi:SurA N-terminal domain-containing protein [Marinobacter changyiensis]|uniref:SurA N-terminal domain-containing protein n=1 Tax=Marinobacter changyiensis TaxID=2604091 RepID=UPI0012640A9D|nr:SurA N-terminal domain-containing protein [Marinobacter changyiensis]
MLQDIRENAQGTIAKIIIGLLIVSLSIWGMDAIIGGFSGEPQVATVNGEDITEREFLRVVQMERQRRLSDMDAPDPALLDDDRIRTDVLEALVREQIMTQDAAAQGLELSDADIDQLITQMPQFQVDGQFDSDRFVMVVRNMGMGVAEFRNAMRNQMVINQIRSGLTQSGVVAPAVVDNLLRIQYQTRDFRTVSLDADSVSSEVEVSDEEIEAFYQDNASQFTVPETVVAEYISLSLSELAETQQVSDEQVAELYQSRAPEMASEERRASHILIEESDDAADQLVEIQEKLSAGEDFAALAESYSDDTVSARDGGDLGFASRGMFDSAFEEALFGLEVGEVSEPVETSFGTHIIKLVEVRQSEAPPLATMAEELRRELAEDAAGKRYAEMRSELADMAYSEGNLTGPAEELGVEVREQAGITREGGEGPFQHPGLVRQLFSDDVLQDKFNTELIDVGNNESVVARVKSYQPQGQRELAEVRDQIRERLVQQKTRERLAERGRDMIARLQNGESLEELDLGVDNWTSHEATDRNDGSLAPEVLRSAFSLERPAEGGVTYGLSEGNDRAVIIALDGVTDGNVEDRAAEREQLQQFLASQKAQQEYLAYQQYLRDKADIERP